MTARGGAQHGDDSGQYDLSVNFAFSEVEPDTLRGLVREVAAQRPEAITTLCTNLRAAQLLLACTE